MAANIKTLPNNRRRSRGNSPISDINVTPLVDVMLVLLIVFMVAAPMLTVGVPVELPKTAANALPTEKEEPLTVTITAEGVVMIQKTQTSADQLVNKLLAISQERDSDRIFLRADGAIPYEFVVQVMGALNKGGFSNISLVTDAGGPAMAQTDD